MADTTASTKDDFGSKSADNEFDDAKSTPAKPPMSGKLGKKPAFGVKITIGKANKMPSLKPPSLKGATKPSPMKGM